MEVPLRFRCPNAAPSAAASVCRTGPPDPDWDGPGSGMDYAALARQHTGGGGPDDLAVAGGSSAKRTSLVVRASSTIFQVRGWGQRWLPDALLHCTNQDLWTALHCTPWWFPHCLVHSCSVVAPPASCRLCSTWWA